MSNTFDTIVVIAAKHSSLFPGLYLFNQSLIWEYLLLV